MPIEQDDALLLRRTPYGESSLVVHVLTPSHGRVQLLAKGAYRPTSRVYCVLDWFDTLELEWHRRPGRDLDLVRRGDRGRRRGAIPRDARRYPLAWSALELAELAAQPGHADPRLFHALEEGLEGIAHGDNPELSLTLFEGRFLEVLGLAPALVRCASCGGEAPPLAARGPARIAFSAGVGGRLCESCAQEARSAGRRVGTLPLHVVESAAMLVARGTPPSAEIQERVRDLFERFLAYHLERHPRLLRKTLERRPSRSTASGSASSLPPTSTKRPTP